MLRGEENLDPMAGSDALELVLELAERRRETLPRERRMTETEQLGIRAALEQLDYLLMEHWEAIDQLAAQSPAGDLAERVPHRVWQLRNGIRVRLSPRDALRQALDLAWEAYRAAGDPDGRSYHSALTWAERFLERHGSAFDALLDG